MVTLGSLGGLEDSVLLRIRVLSTSLLCCLALASSKGRLLPRLSNWKGGRRWWMFFQPWNLNFSLQSDWVTLDHGHTPSPVRLTREMPFTNWMRPIRSHSLRSGRISSGRIEIGGSAWSSRGYTQGFVGKIGIGSIRGNEQSSTRVPQSLHELALPHLPLTLCFLKFSEITRFLSPSRSFH